MKKNKLTESLHQCYLINLKEGVKLYNSLGIIDDGSLWNPLRMYKSSLKDQYHKIIRDRLNNPLA